jgi:dienelactone hydrolase
MAIERELILYDGPGGPFEGLAVRDVEWRDPRPGVMVISNVLGPKEADFLNAERLAELGYAAFVADLYGQGNRTTREDEVPTRFMDALNDDRAMLRDRLLASLATLKSLDAVDSAKTAATGYCFGGKSVLDLVRCGADILGVVSFHGVYESPPFPNVEAMTAKVLVCHGWGDPLAPPEAALALAEELTVGGADWQIHAYGHAGHGFTDKTANMPERGFAYQPDADRRSWQVMQDFLVELFG